MIVVSTRKSSINTVKTQDINIAYFSKVERLLNSISKVNTFPIKSMEVTKRISPSLTETNTFGFELADLIDSNSASLKTFVVFPKVSITVPDFSL